MLPALIAGINAVQRFGKTTVTQGKAAGDGHVVFAFAQKNKPKRGA